jgi:branched-chain amino acid transport system substrate-binding protein
VKHRSRGLVVVAVLAVLAVAGPPLAAQSGTVKVGLVSPLSGPIGFLGEYMRNSAIVEVDRINGQGGLLGRRIELLVRDDELRPEKSVELVREFIERDRVSLIIGPSFTTNALAVRPLISQARVIQMLPTASGPGVLEGAPYTFRMQEPDQLRLQVLARWAARNNFRKLGMVVINDATGQGMARLMPEETRRAGLEYTGHEFFRADDQDLTPQVLKVKEAGADVLMAGTGNSSHAARIALAAQKLGWKVQIIGISGLQGVSYPQLAGDAVIGTVFVATYQGWQAGVPFAQMPRRYAEHVRSIIERFGTVEQGGVKTIKGAPMTGDCIVVWAEAVKRAKSFEADAVKAELERTNMPRTLTPSGNQLVLTPASHEAYQAGLLTFYRWIKRPDGTYAYVETR